MPRHSTPNAYRVSAEDLQQVVREHATEWGVTAYFETVLGFPHGSKAYCEVILRAGLYTPSGKELERQRFPLDYRVVDRWPGQMLAALMAAYDTLDRDPWLWPQEKRRAVTGE